MGSPEYLWIKLQRMCLNDKNLKWIDQNIGKMTVYFQILITENKDGELMIAVSYTGVQTR